MKRLPIANPSLFVCTALCLAAGCTPQQRGGPPSSASPAAAQAAGTAGGGVDVGNMRSALSLTVPGTHIVVDRKESWQPTEDGARLRLTSNASQIALGPADVQNLASPNAIALKAVLDAREPGKARTIVRFNGLEGVRTDEEISPARTRSELYLVSELNDFIKIEMRLEGAQAKEEGEAMLRTARIRYKGVAISAPAKTVELRLSDNPYVIFAGDCVGYHCHPGVVTRLSRTYQGEYEIQIGTAGYDHGRIVDLGAEADVPFDSVRVEGPYLAGPGSMVQLADIYSEFTPQTQTPDRDRMTVEPRRTYLIRTISWPKEDMIVKARIDSIVGGVARVTYQKLAAVPKETLAQQVEAINRYTLTVEKPRQKGEVVLYNRSVFGSYFFASFNFAFGTSGNMFITHNGWDLLFDGSFGCPHTGSSIGDVIELGPGRTLESVRASDVPDLNLPRSGYLRGAQPKIGGVYLVYHADFGSSQLTVGAFRLLELGPGGRWARIEWRRIAVGPAPRFQRWLPMSKPTADFEAVLDGTDGRGSCNLLADSCQAQSRDAVSFWWDARSEPYFSADDRPYDGTNGFLQLPKGTDLASLTRERVEGLARASGTADAKPGDLFAVRIETFEYRVLAAFQLLSNEGGKARVRVRVLSRERIQAAAME